MLVMELLAVFRIAAQVTCRPAIVRAKRVGPCRRSPEYFILCRGEAGQQDGYAEQGTQPQFSCHRPHLNRNPAVLRIAGFRTFIDVRTFHAAQAVAGNFCAGGLDVYAVQAGNIPAEDEFAVGCS